MNQESARVSCPPKLTVPLREADSWGRSSLHGNLRSQRPGTHVGLEAAPECSQPQTARPETSIIEKEIAIYSFSGTLDSGT